jgi:hypothetical protein
MAQNLCEHIALEVQVKVKLSSLDYSVWCTNHTHATLLLISQWIG